MSMRKCWPSVPSVGRRIGVAPRLRVLVAGLVLALPAAAFFADGVGDVDLERSRATYLELTRAAQRGDWSRFETLREQLGRYPLAPYADYERLLVRLPNTSGTQARRFVEAHESSPLGVRYLGHYLDNAGRTRRWADYLDAAAGEPRSEKLRCYYARAKRGRGEETEAWRLATGLFLSASSVDDACDPLFRLWRESGGLTPALVWERAKLAFAARETGLLRYVASLGGPRPALDTLLQVYREPQRTPLLVRGLAEPHRGEVLALGLERHSRYAPAGALQQYLDLGAADLDDAQRARVEHAIAFRGLLEHDPDVAAWADARLAGWRDDQLTGLRLRWAIGEQDWQTITTHSEALTPAEATEGVWIYWRARALEARGDTTAARDLYASLAGERSYYGFLAADRIGSPYSFDEASPASLAAVSPAALPDWLREATWRVHELNAIDEPRLAQAEWAHVLQRVDSDAQVALARLAGEQGWYRLAIDAANAGKAWDALELRFPLAYVDAFRERASRQALPVSELMAIARRESAFFPSARSPVGARGLMQLMPATGIAVARSAGLRLDVSELYSVDHNLDLGSAYYRQLLDRFDGNRAVALAAYNAGPNRVQHWVGRDLPIDAWIETIPYRETRDYVKAVLAYSVVFDHRLGRSAELLSAAERHARY